MKKLILALALVAGSAAMAHESDEANMSPEQFQQANNLPGSIVVIKEGDKVTLVPIKEKLAAGPLKQKDFERVAEAANLGGIELNSTNEREASSTSAWGGFAIAGRGPYGGFVAGGVRAGGYWGGAVNVGWGWNNNWGWNNGWNNAGWNNVGGCGGGCWGGGGCGNGCFNGCGGGFGCNAPVVYTGAASLVYVPVSSGWYNGASYQICNPGLFY